MLNSKFICKLPTDLRNPLFFSTMRTSAIILITLVATIAAASVPSNFQPKAGFQFVGTANKKIFISPILTGDETYGISWQSALERCVSNGYRLANIGNKAENDVIEAFVTGNGLDVTRWSWIDGTNFISTDTFFSIHTGQNLTYFDWVNYGRPVSDDKIRCLRWSHNSGEAGMWDVYCDSDKNGVICETPAL